MVALSVQQVGTSKETLFTRANITRNLKYAAFEEEFSTTYN